MEAFGLMFGGPSLVKYNKVIKFSGILIKPIARNSWFFVLERPTIFQVQCNQHPDNRQIIHESGF